MINTLLEHVPIKMEVKDIAEPMGNSANNEMTIHDDKINGTDDDDDDDESADDEEDEESDIESDTLEIEQEATMIISSDEEAELEAQRIRFPNIVISKKSAESSCASSRSSSRNSQTSSSISSYNKHITYEIVHPKRTVDETDKREESTSPQLKNVENKKILENLNKENNNNTQIRLNHKTEKNKLENSNKILESSKNKKEETSKRLDNNKTDCSSKKSEISRNVENLLKSPVHVSGQRSRRSSNNSACSVASTVASDSAETESCGNIYVFNLQQKLIFNCEFCDLKYGDLDNFARHLHEAHKLFSLDEDPEKENAPRNLRKSSRMHNTTQKNSTSVKKEPLQCLEVMAEPPVALPASFLAEPLDSCGNVFILNHRKLFVVCGYCECKYANMDLFEKHLRQQHRIFEGCRNEVNVLPKVEVKEELLVINEVEMEKPKITAPQAMITMSAEIPLDISITPQNEAETLSANETCTDVNNEKHSSSRPLEMNNAEPNVVGEEKNLVIASAVFNIEEIVNLPEAVNNVKKSSPKKTRNKRRFVTMKSSAPTNKRPKRIARNTKDENGLTKTCVEDKVPAATSEISQVLKTEKVTETLKDKEPTEISRLSIESMTATLTKSLITEESTEVMKSNDSEITTSRESRNSTRPAKHAKKLSSRRMKKNRKSITDVDSKNDVQLEDVVNALKETRPKKCKEEQILETESEADLAELQSSSCPKKFSHNNSLKIHERTHTGEKTYECEICHKSFAARANLHMHKKFHMGDSYKKYKCDICDKKFFRNIDRKTHMAAHSFERVFQCNICHLGFPSKGCLQKHIERDHVKDTLSKCKKKPMRSLPSTKVEREDSQSEFTTIPANLGPPMSATPSLIRNANLVDDLNTDPVIDIIEQLQNEMRANERTNVGGNAVTFTINAVTGIEASQKASELRPIMIQPQHNEINSTDDIKPPTLLKIVKRFFCDLCPRTFEKHIRLVEHKRLHTGEKPFACDECGKQFRIRMRLNEHKLRHSKEKKFKCEMCQLACCTKQDLNLHMRHHTNDRRYQCSMCPKAFVRSSDLKIHVRVHTGEKPYVCDICHKCFRANQNLSVHKKSHMGDASKTYKCEYCDKKFMRNIDRKVHMRSHTGEKPYKCEICQRGYSSKFNVRAHIERDHISANGVGTPPKGKKKPGPKPRALREELEKQKQLIEELQHQLLQQIKTDEKIIPDEDDLLQEQTLQDSTITATTTTSPTLTATNSRVDPIQSAYELLNKLKSSTTTSRPLTLIPSPPPIVEPPPPNSPPPMPTVKNNTTNLLPLTITQKLEQPSPAASSSSSTTVSCLTAPTPAKTTATKVVSQKTSLGIQQVSVTVSMQVENVTPNPIATENEHEDMLTTSNSSNVANVKKERKITSYFTVVGQKADV